MKSSVCERCLCKSSRVALRISNENLCETCEQQCLRNNGTRPRPSSSGSLGRNLSSELNVDAPPFQPRKTLRRSRSTGAILQPLTEKETPVKRKSPPSKQENGQALSLNQNQDGGDGTLSSTEDQNEITTILSNSIAKYSMVTKSPTLRKVQELCKERNIKVSGRKDELKARLGLDLPPSYTQSQTTRLKTKGAKPKISEGTVVQKSTEPGKLQPPGTQNSLPSLKVTLPLKRPRPASVPEPVNIYEIEEDHVYEVDDEDEHFLHQGHRPTPRATISPLNTSHGWEGKLQRLQDMIQIIGQKNSLL